LTDSLAFPELDVPFSLGSGEVELVEAEVHPLIVGRTVQEVMVPGQVHIVAIRRDGRFRLAAPSAVLQPDDVICVAVVATAVDRLRGLLGLV
jgi:trk system potassium uptake protein TrkA